MKKIIVCVSIFTVILSIFAACSKDQQEGGTTTIAAATTGTTQRSTIADDYSTTEPQYTVGSVQTSEKIGDADEFYINYYDENGFVAKVEIYENGRMAYYYTVVAADEMGNCLQSKYYTPNGTFVATYDNTFFFDSAGNKISETEFEKRLGR